VVDFRAVVYDGSYHDVDSSEMAFKIAGSLAFKSCMEKCDPVLLEPIMVVDVTAPEESMGDVLGNLTSRRGRMLGMENRGGSTVIKAHVPMAEMLNYAPDLNSITGGRGSFSMEFDHYAEVPAHIAQKIIEASPKAGAQED
jgi:elongation factor G